MTGHSRFHTPRRGTRAPHERLWVSFVGFALILFLFLVLWRMEVPATGRVIASGACLISALVAWYACRWLDYRDVQSADCRLCLRCRGPFDKQGDSGECRASGREDPRVTLVWCRSNTYAQGGTPPDDDDPFSGVGN